MNIHAVESQASKEFGERHGQSQSQHGADPRLVLGRGLYTDDETLPGQVYAAFLRSPIGSGHIKSIDTSALEGVPGVLGIFTAKDIAKAGWGSFDHAMPPPGMTPAAFRVPSLPIFASDRVVHIGQLIAMVVAQTRAQAEAACDLIVVDLEATPAVVDVEAALQPDAPQLWDFLPGNVAYAWRAGDLAATQAARARAAHVVELRIVNKRMIGNPMEPRGAIATYDATTESYVLISGSQGVSSLRDSLAKSILRIAPDKLRVVSNDVGGGFGIKAGAYAEQAAVLLAARNVGRPVKWISTRSEAFMSDHQARDSVYTGWLALDVEGHFLGIEADVAVAVGAFVSGSTTVVGTKNVSSGISGPYLIPAIAAHTRGVLTNTVPTGPYRGAGRPEISYFVERLIDEAAKKMGVSAAELRARNLLKPSAIPHTTALGTYYDSGDFPQMLEQALAFADWDGFAHRQSVSRANRKLRGIGISSFLEVASSAMSDTADLRFTEDGMVEIRISVQSNGQDHATTFRMLAEKTLQVPFDKIRIITGDSSDTPGGPPTVGSRGAVVGGGAIHAGCLSAIERGRKIVGQLLEVSESDVEFADGAFRVSGTDLAISLLDLPRRMQTAKSPIEQTLDGVEKFDASHPTFPNGCHIAEVEIDCDTGHFSLVAYTAIDDVGTVLNEPSVEGQVMGGIAQGFGQVSGEECIYDDEGQILTGSFMDYGMPRADDLPSFQLGFLNTPSPATPLGAKGCGEAGTTGALPAIMNAINNALASVDAGPVGAPARPQTIWRALQEASS